MQAVMRELGLRTIRRHVQQSESHKPRQKTHTVQALESRDLFAGQSIGINLSTLRDSNEEWVFVDVFEQHRAFLPQLVGKNSPWDTGAPLALTAEGYPILAPGQAAGTLMMTGMFGHYPAGRYIVNFDGDGDIAFGFDAKLMSRVGNRLEVDVTPTSQGIYMRIDRSNAANPIRNLRMTMPGFENHTSKFHPEFLNRLSPFDTIRFMDWQRTNGAVSTQWQDRTTPNHASESRLFGASVETMVDLANELDADPWFCMPHLADDNYVTQFATLVKNRLEPGRKVYVEWSNEVWNGAPGFQQADWVVDEAARQGITIAKLTANEASRDFQIWHNVWGVDKTRIVRVAAAQHYNIGVGTALARELNGAFDAIAPAGYFDMRLKQTNFKPTSTTTPAEILTHVLDNVDKFALPAMLAHKKLADTWSATTGRNIRLITYEGGQHLTAGGVSVPYQQALFDAQIHPLMYECYKRMLEGFQGMGGDMFTAYSYVSGQNNNGSWGHLKYQDEPLANSVKFQALLDAIGGSYGADTEVPVSQFVSATPGHAGSTFSDIVVRFTDNVSVDFSDLDNGDVEVRGPDGTLYTTTLVGTSVGVDSQSIDATYRLTAPGGQWDPADNGFYTVKLRANQVSDTTGNLAVTQDLCQFEVVAYVHPQTRWLTLMYQDVLGRSIGASEATYWLSQIDLGQSLEDVAYSLVNSDERRGAIIKTLYRDYLGRDPDAGGMAYWLNVWTINRGPERVQAGIISSPEYYQSAGGTNADWVKALYTNLLGRNATQKDVTYWSNRIGNGKTFQVVMGFVTSDEYRLNRIQEWYQLYLGRAADATDGRYWLRLLKYGVPQDRVQAILLASAEYQAR